MSVALAVVLVAVAMATLAFAASASRSVDADPIDPAVEERALIRWIGRHPRARRFLGQRFDRRSAGGFLLTVGFAITFAVALGLGVLLDMIDENSGLARLDRSASEWGSENADARAVDVLTWITHLGSTVVVIAALAVAAVVDFLRHRNRDVFLFAAVVGLGQTLINNGLKEIVSRERPSVLRLVEASGNSFPSGHSAAAAAGAAAVALILGRNQRRGVRTALATAAALVAAAVATSRALLGVHWVTDVVGGLLLGWGWFLLVAIAFGGRLQRLGDPAERAGAVAPGSESGSHPGSQSGSESGPRVARAEAHAEHGP